VASGAEEPEATGAGQGVEKIGRYPSCRLDLGRPRGDRRLEFPNRGEDISRGRRSVVKHGHVDSLQ
jgi:hypothetical protein